MFFLSKCTVCNRLKGILISTQNNLLESLVTNGSFSLYKIDTLTIFYYYNNSYSFSYLKFTQAGFVSCAILCHGKQSCCGGSFWKAPMGIKTQTYSRSLIWSAFVFENLPLGSLPSRIEIQALSRPPWKSICLYSRRSEWWLCVSGNEFSSYNAVFIGRERWRKF